MTPLAWSLTAVAFCTSTLSGVAGLGGGTILIAVLYSLGMAPVEAVPLFAAVQCVSNVSRTAAYVKDVEWHASGWFTLAAVPSTFLLAPYAALADENAIRLILALLILATLVPHRREDDAPLPPRQSFILAGLLNGSIGMFVGATGLFVGRLFLRPEWKKEQTIATLALTQTFGHLLRVVAYGFAGFSAFAQPGVLIPLCLAVIVGTWTGKHLNSKLDHDQFERLFKLVLVVLSIKLVWDSVRGFGWI